jgi:hypothetical protein
VRNLKQIALELQKELDGDPAATRWLEGYRSAKVNAYGNVLDYARQSRQYQIASDGFKY